MRTASHSSDVIRPWPLVAIAAWVVPGLGHVLIGHSLRGMIVGGTLLTLFVAGLLIGGIDVIDRRESPLWFAGQLMLGPITIAAQTAHDQLDAQRDEQFRQAGFSPESKWSRDDAIEHFLAENKPMAYRNSIGRVNEIGTLYCALAGVLNLLAVLDAVGRASARASLPTAEEDEAIANDASAGGDA